MSKIETISKWSAHAALHSAIEDTDQEDSVLVLITHKDNRATYRAANCTNAEAIYMMEHRKSRMFYDLYLEDIDE